MLLCLLESVRNSWQILTPLENSQGVQDVSDCELASENLNNSPPQPFLKTLSSFFLLRPQSNTKIDNIYTV